MAQSGFTPILLYASSTPSAAPAAGNLTSSAAGAELALNYADGKLFYKDSGGSVQTLASKATGSIGGSTTQVQYNSSGSLAGSANLTFNGTTLTANSATVSTGNLTFSSTAQRITGDFSNATVANRLMFQTSTVNGATGVFALPNGTGAASLFGAFSNSDSANAVFGSLYAVTTEVMLTSGITGAATYAPMTFYTGGSERMRIDTSGNLLFQGGRTIGVYNATNSSLGFCGGATFNNDGASIALRGSTASFNGYGMEFYAGGSERVRIDTSGNVLIGTTTPSGTSRLYIDSTEARIQSRNSTSGANGYVGAVNPNEWRVWTTVATDLTLGTDATERIRITATGNVGIGTASPGVNGLDVGRSGGTTVIRSLQADTGAGTFAQLLAQKASGAAGEIIVDQTTVYVGSTTNSPVVFRANVTERMRIDTSGNVGIGTASPSGKLDVLAAANQRFLVTERGTSAVVLDAVNAANSAYQLMLVNGSQVVIQTGATERMRITAAGNIVAGASAALATTATDGFLYVPTCAGTPTGTPTAITGMAPIVVDTTNNKLYFYSGGTWRDAGP